MIKREAGLTMVELLITMAVFVFAIVAITNVFVPLLTQFKQQSKIAETQIEGIVGLEILRRDIEQAGFGLPWVIPTAVNYSEGSGTTVGTIPPPNSSVYNFNDSPSNPPRAIVSADNVSGLGGSDYLVIKATSVADNSAATKWTHVVGTGGGSTLMVWGKSSEDLNLNDRVIVMIPSRGTNSQRILVNSGSSFSVQFASPFPPAFSPSTTNDLYLIYGVDPSTNLRMPFNRADYYIDFAGTRPPRCAAGTGILVKSVINQSNGDRSQGIPLLDCVADMQVIYRLDRNGDGTLTSTSVLNDLSGNALTSQQIREQLKEIRIYILAHEGQKDANYTYPNATIDIPAAPDPGAGSGRTFSFSTAGITNWQNYRWKLYALVVKPNNLGIQ